MTTMINVRLFNVQPPARCGVAHRVACAARGSPREQRTRRSPKTNDRITKLESRTLRITKAVSRPVRGAILGAAAVSRDEVSLFVILFVRVPVACVAVRGSALALCALWRPAPIGPVHQSTRLSRRHRLARTRTWRIERWRQHEVVTCGLGSGLPGRHIATSNRLLVACLLMPRRKGTATPRKVPLQRCQRPSRAKAALSHLAS